MSWPWKLAASPLFCIPYDPLVKNRLAGYTVALHHLAQVLERIQLNLPHPFARHANILADLFKRRSTIAVQSKPSLHNGALLVV
jgi:hypothetical protein